MKKTKHEFPEIVSFNSAVPAVHALIELGDGALDLVSGGQAQTNFCPTLGCTELGGCNLNTCKQFFVGPL